PQWMSQISGQREILLLVASHGDYDGGRENTSVQHQRITEPVISADEISSTLGIKKNGVDALLVTGGEEVFRLRWPFPPKTASAAPASVPAPWTRPGFQMSAKTEEVPIPAP